MKITHNLTIDLQRRGNLQKIDVVQGDTYTRLVNISLYNNGVLWDVPTDSGILVRYHKPDGTSGIYEELPDGSPAGVVEENNVLITLAPQMLTAPGKVPTQVSIVVDDQVLSTFSFIVDVEEDPSKGAVGSENYYNWKSAFIPQTTDAHVGQYLEIAKVDSHGRIEEVKSVVNPAISAELVAGEAKRIAENADFNANEAMSTAGVAKNLAIRNSDDIATLSSSKLPQVTGAKVGQYIKITEVDELGRVVAFEAVNAPTSGSISGDLEMQGDSISNVGSLSFTGPNNTSVDGFWIQSGTAVSNEDGNKTSVAEFYSSDTDEGVVIRNVATGVEDSDAVNLAQLNSVVSGKLDAPATAEVGQTIVVKAVDENGKPIVWEAVDFSSGGGGGEKGLVAHIATTQEVDSIALNTDLDGNPLKLTDGMYLVSVVCAGTATNSANKGEVFYVNNIAVATAKEAITNYNCWTRTEYIVDTITNAVWSTWFNQKSWYYVEKPASNPLENNMSFDAVNGEPGFARRNLNSDFAEVTSIKVQGGTFGVGSDIRIWRL